MDIRVEKSKKALASNSDEVIEALTIITDSSGTLIRKFAKS